MEKNKDIGLVVATKREALWIEVRNIRKEQIEVLEKRLVVEKEVLKRAEEIIEEEKDAN